MSTSDDLWRRLTARTGLLTTKQLVWRWIAVGVVSALGAAVWLSGAVQPRVSTDLDVNFASGGVDRDDLLRPTGMRGQQMVEITDHGFFPFEVTGVSADIPGLRVVSWQEVEAYSGPDRVISLDVTFAVTDCAAVPLEPRPVRIAYRNAFRSGTFDADEGERQVVTENGERRFVAWQRTLADEACNDPFGWSSL